MATLNDLGALLRGVDGAGYGAYKRARGAWKGHDFTLVIDHVQGDPYATPSRLRLCLPPSSHGVPDEAWSAPPRRIGLCDFLLRSFRSACASLPRVGGSGKSGLVLVPVESPLVIERAGCAIDRSGLELRFRVGLPARGRRCLGRSAAQLLTEHLPRALDSVRWTNVDRERARAWIETTEEHAHLQSLLPERGLVAFVRDGALLPRRSGVSHEPLEGGVPFESPEALRVSLPTVHADEVTGMGVPRGVTVITGGGFHGKTTLLQAIQEGVYPHVPGDGREWVVSVPDAAKVRSEDGRAVTGVDLRSFIHDLPLGRDTARFSTPDASGSTSLAADILESLESGSTALLMDEDTCATNLMVRDARMQELVLRETITPLIDRARELVERGVSVILVTGGGGDYLDVADRVILMEEYRPRDVTREAREVAVRHPTGRHIGEAAHPLRAGDRIPLAESFDARRRSGKVKAVARGTDTILFGSEDVDLASLEQLVDHGQARAVAALMREMQKLCNGRRTLRQLIEAALERARREGLYAVDRQPELAMPRPQEVLKAASRLRSLRVAE